MYHDLGMGWFHGSFAAAGAGASRAMNSVNAMMNFVNLQNLCLVIPKGMQEEAAPTQEEAPKKPTLILEK